MTPTTAPGSGPAADLAAGAATPGDTDAGDRATGDVVVAVDGSEGGDRALAWAVREAQLRGAGLTVAHTYYWPHPGLGAMEASEFLMDALEKDSHEVLRLAADRARELAPELAVSVVAKLGPPVPTLAGLGTKGQLLVVGSRGLGGFTGLLLGSVGTGVVATAQCPVVVVRGRHEPAPADPVVVGLDASGISDAALRQAFQAAQRRSCPLVAVHCWQGPADVVRQAVGREPIDDDAWERAAADDLAEQLAQAADELGTVAVTPVVRRGRPSSVLLEYAASASLLVVGTRGRGELKGLLLGSTSRAMVQHADCPVLVAR